jgi:hypothetical protein
MGDVIRIPVTSAYLTASQAAKLMGCDVGYLYRLKLAGWLMPVTKVGQALVYRRADIENYILTHPRLGRKSAAK